MAPTTGLGEGVGDGEGVADGLAVGRGVGLGDALALADAVGLGEAVALPEGLGDGLGDALPDGNGVGVEVPEAAGFGKVLPEPPDPLHCARPTLSAASATTSAKGLVALERAVTYGRVSSAGIDRFHLGVAAAQTSICPASKAAEHIMRAFLRFMPLTTVIPRPDGKRADGRPLLVRQLIVYGTASSGAGGLPDRPPRWRRR